MLQRQNCGVHDDDDDDVLAVKAPQVIEAWQPSKVPYIMSKHSFLYRDEGITPLVVFGNVSGGVRCVGRDTRGPPQPRD